MKVYTPEILCVHQSSLATSLKLHLDTKWRISGGEAGYRPSYEISLFRNTLLQ